jgi:hypothetical protein
MVGEKKTISEVTPAAAHAALQTLRSFVEAHGRGNVRIVSREEWSEAAVVANGCVKYPEIYEAFDLLASSPVGTRCKILDGGDPKRLRKRVAGYASRFGLRVRTQAANGWVYAVSTQKFTPGTLVCPGKSSKHRAASALPMRIAPAK